MALPVSNPVPSSIPTMLGSDDQAKTEYFDALQKTLTALEARANQGTNWWQIAAAALNPGRTGTFGEAVGNIAGAMGAQQDKQLEMQIPIAQARAQISGQKYEVENQSKAIKMLSAAIGMPPEQVSQQLANGSLPPAAVANISPQAYAAIATLSPKVGDIVKNIAEMSNKNATLNLETDKFKEVKTQNQVTNAREDLKSGMGIAELVAKYGQAIVSMINTNKPSAPAPAPIPGSPGTGGPGMPAPPPMQVGVPGPQPTAPPMVGPPQMSMPAVQGPPAAPPMAPRPAPAPAGGMPPLSSGPTIAPRPSPMSGIRPDLQVPPDVTQTANDLAGLPLAGQIEVQKKRIEDADKIWQTKRDEIINYTPQLVQGSNTNLRKLDFYATKYPEVFGLMQKQGTIAALQQAAQDGVNLSAGQFNARIGLNVKGFLEKVRLDTDQQQAVRDVTRVLGEEFLSNVKANKGLLGVNPTDNDARLLQAPMVNTDDSSKAVQMWARNQLLLNKQREALYNGYQQHAEKAGPSASPGSFFRPGSIYEKINDDYAKYRMQLFNQFNPK